MVLAYNTNAGGGLASGVDKLANAFLEKKRRQGLASGLEQIQNGDWQGGVNTISETDPNTALGLVQYKQKADDAMNLEQMKIAAAEKARNSLTPYQREMLALKKQQIENGGNGTVAQQNIEYLAKNMGIPLDQAAMLVYGGNNPTLNMAMLGKKGQEAADKKIGEYVADEQIAQQQMKTLKPKAENALRRAKESLADGTGLGQFGGWGWTTGKGGQNRANIKNAQAQINTTMRGLLKQMGVGSTELNSAVEAEAYRYMLDPNTPIEQQEQVLKNFEEDYLSGALQKDLEEIYGNKSQAIISDPRVKEALDNGYTMEEIQAYLGK